MKLNFRFFSNLTHLVENFFPWFSTTQWQAFGSICPERVRVRVKRAQWIAPEGLPQRCAKNCGRIFEAEKSPYICKL